ncbi:MAG: Arm DNA-binding domain-containing protein [Chromatiales bacterium]|nr:Arm DNA-binding domain-containing protein [Chromatiales bacterium]MCK7581555.1 Arm DNA-binding domain-containing protein [Chromatiales bacterium]
MMTRPDSDWRIYPSGRKAFVFSYRAQGRKRLMTIGTYGALTLEQARIQARAELAKVETQGADLLAVRQRQAQGETFRDLCQTYMERHGHAKKSGADDQRRIDSRLLPLWGSPRCRPSPARMWRRFTPRSARPIPMRPIASWLCCRRCLIWRGAGASCPRIIPTRPATSTASRKPSGIAG